MKCVSLIQPWATLIVLGVKRQEIRTWATRYRGQLAIHASKRFPEEARRLCQEEPLRSLLRQFGACDLPRGSLLGVVQLADCRVMADQRQLTLDRSPDASVPSSNKETRKGNSDRNYEFLPSWLPHAREGEGNRGSRSLWIWEFIDPRSLARPLPYRGQMGIYNVMINEIDLTQTTAPLLTSNQQWSGD